MEALRARNYGHRPLLVPIKVFTCKYCGRRFLNSRALGGHQNAHKKERTIWMAAMSKRKSMGVEDLALLRKRIQEEFRSHGPDTEAIAASNAGASSVVHDLDLDLHL